MAFTTFIQHLFLVFFVNYVFICEAKPGLLDDFILEDECESIINGSDTCFVGYDEENCNADDWEPFQVKGDGIAVPFNRTTSSIKDFFGYQDGIESLVLKKGCRAVLYKDKECTSDPFTLKAETNKDLVIKELSESTASDYGKKY